MHSCARSRNRWRGRAFTHAGRCWRVRARVTAKRRRSWGCCWGINRMLVNVRVLAQKNSPRRAHADCQANFDLECARCIAKFRRLAVGRRASKYFLTKRLTTTRSNRQCGITTLVAGLLNTAFSISRPARLKRPHPELGEGCGVQTRWTAKSSSTAMARTFDAATLKYGSGRGVAE